MSEHVYLTPESLSIIGSCSPTGPFAIAVHWIIADLIAIRNELKAAQEENRKNLELWDADAKDKDAEIARLRQCAKYESDVAAQAVTELNRMRTALESAPHAKECAISEWALRVWAYGRGSGPKPPEKPDCNCFKSRALNPQPAQQEPLMIETNGIALIAAERQRQIEKEGWTPEHDDAHKSGQLADAVACYIRPTFTDGELDYWPWEPKWWKCSGDRVRDLVKAGALIAAEIDRLQRQSRALNPQTAQQERIKCNSCDATYDAKWIDTTCSKCDGIIGGDAQDAGEEKK